MEISILVPTLALDTSLIEALAKSIDYPVKDKVVINNGREEDLLKWKEQNPDWKVYQAKENLGVSGAWNIAPEICTNDHWLIINDDHQLQPGCLEKICKGVAENPDHEIYYVNLYEAFDIFVWTRAAAEKFGLFDENFYPAYYEDWEMRLRFDLGGVKKFFLSDNSFPIKHGRTKAAGQKYTSMLKEVDVYNREYFLRKWGKITDKKEGAFLWPFDTFPPYKLSHWKLEKKRRKELMKIWNNFFHAENVSLY